MILELLGSRIMAPYVGTSIFVWTNLIGVVLAFLSIGYLWGGKLADEGAKPKVFSYLILASAVWISLLALVYDPILASILFFIRDIRIAALVASVILFGIPSILLGMVPPYAAKLSLVSLQEAGQSVGRIYALSTIGSIAGTFLTGFFLLSFFSNTSILLVLAAVLTSTSLLASRSGAQFKIVLVLFLASLSLTGDVSAALFNGKNFADVNTPYSRVWIYDLPVGEPAKIRLMQINDEWSSARFLKNEELAAPYTRYYRLVSHFVPKLQKTLMLGGAGYSYPQDFLKRFPEGKMDVVEIDPGVTELAEKYFGLQKDERLSIVHEDARVFLNRNTKKYDAIFGDVFRSSSVPFHLTTEEALQRIHDSLAQEGVFMINLISSLDGENSRFLKGEVAGLKKIFPQVYIFATADSKDAQRVQNLMIVAIKSKKIPSWRSQDPELDRYLKQRCESFDFQGAPIFTDQFAPVEYYSLGILKEVGPRKNPHTVYWNAKLTETKEA